MSKKINFIFGGIFFFLLGLTTFCLSLKYSPGLDAESIKEQKSRNDYNVILIFIDALRTDHLSCYGYHRETSPNIDKLAEESIVCENNFSPISYTIASFMSIITSLYPTSHGVLYVMKDKLSLRIKTLAQILKMYGYTTAWFGPKNCPHLDPEIGFGWGFDVVGEYVCPKEVDKHKLILLDWIIKNKDKKFFLNFHTYKIHTPYLPSAKYSKKFVKQKSEKIISSFLEYKKAIWNSITEALILKKGGAYDILGENFASDLAKENFFNEEFNPNRKFDKLVSFFAAEGEIHKWEQIECYVYEAGVTFKNNKDVEYFESLYDAEILEYDAEMIGPLIVKLKELNLYDKTIIIICADHGDEFGEHGGGGHGDTLYNEVVHVPLIIRVPWIKEGQRIQELTQTVDIMPTLLDLLDIPIPHQAQGKSLVDLIGKKNPTPLREYVFGQLPGIGLASIRSKEWKLILNSENGTRELFNLQLDPGEQKNLYFEKPDITAKLEEELKKWEKSLPCYKDKDYPFSPEIDKETQERIKKTGYW